VSDTSKNCPLSPSKNFHTLTYSMAQSPSQSYSLHFMEPDGSLLHLKVSDAWPYPKPDQSSPFPPFCFLKVLLNIILPFMPGFSKWSLFLTFPHHNPVCTFPLPYTCYMAHPCHSSQFDCLNNIW